jgi:septum formation protein
MRKSESPPVILASRSAGRAALLRAAGYRFRQVPANVREPRARRGVALERHAAEMAAAKAVAVAGRHPRAVVIGADTALGLGRRVIGKPRDLREAERMLRMLGGRAHRVCSAAFVIFPAGASSRPRKTALLVDTALVRLRRWPAPVLRRFVSLTRPLAWAGAYAVQDPLSAAIVETVRGDLATVIGLPMKKLDRALRAARPRERRD